MSNPAAELQAKIRSTIPLSDVMQFEIVELGGNSIQVCAPLSPNVNIHGTGFAGSIYSLAVLTGWAMCMHILTSEKIDGDLVVGKAEIKYRSAVTGDIDCRCVIDESVRQSFIERITTSGKAKVELEVIVGGEANAVLLGSYFVSQTTK
jgi:thioesterase domain-containing protein